MSEKIWFLSDLHFGHRSILDFCSRTRPFASLKDMEYHIIEKWQATVGQNDHVYLLGDVFFCPATDALRIVDQLPGQKHLILGNHDNVIRHHKPLRDKFVATHDYLEIKVAGQKIVMMHFPIAEFNGAHYGAYHLYGHAHGNFDHPGKAVDVGIDGPLCQNCAPIGFDAIDNYMKDRPILSHHGKVGVSPMVVADVISEKCKYD